MFACIIVKILSKERKPAKEYYKKSPRAGPNPKKKMNISQLTLLPRLLSRHIAMARSNNFITDDSLLEGATDALETYRSGEERWYYRCLGASL